MSYPGFKMCSDPDPVWTSLKNVTFLAVFIDQFSVTMLIIMPKKNIGGILLGRRSNTDPSPKCSIANNLRGKMAHIKETANFEIWNNSP